MPTDTGSGKPQTRGTTAAALLGILMFAAVLSFASCDAIQDDTATLWTDIPEMMLAVELFNIAREDQLLELRYVANLAEALAEDDAQPSLAIGKHLRSRTIHGKFQSLGYLFGELYVNQSSFYPAMLDSGKIGGRQLLLPVSFNLPAIVFAKGSHAPDSPLLIDLDSMGVHARSYNRIESGRYVRMGFSPRWNPDFLVLFARGSGSGFHEDKKLAWDPEKLAGTVGELRAWSREKNTSNSAERDFEFKYLFTPDYQYVAEGRTLFVAMDSRRLLTLPVAKRGALDFRWYSIGGAIPIDEDMVFAAILRSGKGKSTAETFLKWFFKEENQKRILEKAAGSAGIGTGIGVGIGFGIADGFSSIREVNEKYFPASYPNLAGKMFSPGHLSLPPVLPPDWPAIADNVLVPWILESIESLEEKPDPAAEFAARLEEYRQNATITSVR